MYFSVKKYYIDNLKENGGYWVSLLIKSKEIVLKDILE